MVCVHADVLQIVVLATRPDALLRVGRAHERRQWARRVRVAEKDGLELRHPAVDEQQRGVVVGHDRGRWVECVRVLLCKVVYEDGAHTLSRPELRLEAALFEGVELAGAGDRAANGKRLDDTRERKCRARQHAHGHRGRSDRGGEEQRLEKKASYHVKAHCTRSISMDLAVRENRQARCRRLHRATYTCTPRAMPLYRNVSAHSSAHCCSPALLAPAHSLTTPSDTSLTH